MSNQKSQEVVDPSDSAAAAAAPAGGPDPYKSSSFIGHSLWMVPSAAGGTLEAYDTIIGDMSKELGTFHFLPHITLVAAIMEPVEVIVQKTRQLATMLAPYQFQLEDIAHKDAYFQCIFATMKRTDEVVQANATARAVFAGDKRSDPPYMPHLSLVYGDLSATEKTTRWIPRLRQTLFSDGGGGAPSEPTSTIPVDAIEIWSTQGDVKEWYLVERVPLVGSTKSEVVVIPPPL